MESVSSLFSDQSSLSSVPSDFNEHEAEQIVEVYQPRNNQDLTKDILSSFLRFLPAEGRTTLANFIVNTGNNHESLYSLSQHLKNAILIPMRARGATPSISPSPFDDEEEIGNVAATMDESGSRKDQTLLKKLCLERDNYRCMATGIIDSDAGTQENPGPKAPTNLCHIIPFSLGKWNKSTEHQIAQVWATLGKLFPAIGLGPGEVNDPKNLMTLWDSAHSAFAAFSLAFEPTGEPNQYRMLMLGERHTVLLLHLPAPQGGPNGPRLVTFDRHGGTTIDLPSPALLQMHAALAKVLHASGMAKYMEDLVRDGDEIGCLAPSGRSNLSDLLLLKMLGSRCEAVN
ncbi:conserved hypothetical protein [Histoplasma capsulatum G186AR]|uniref:HNH nuclease domain-containing protein n=2 Tax=Ajellomyces capsulatus TaxID=5037 RepID=C0NAA9_AJECG|nr:uncharacterized protein HCBG_00055 [Histoplasma capsulatum G186AR]EEH10600.1 conserved hypothetical protein [Histoplasma capsulatum G186AR]KAG5288485.1 hypothetical protein I7I52_11991 [Histoplasma capsulatum]QSS71060.1 hypothetical protein I7I50_01777 [Histoplasma capsulatum G186AR]